MVSKCVVSCTTTDICYVCIRYMYTYICIHHVLLMWLTCDWHVSNQRPVFPCGSLNVVTYGSNCVQNAMICIGKSHKPIFWSHTKSWDVEAEGLSGTKKKARGWVGVYSDLPAKNSLSIVPQYKILKTLNISSFTVTSIVKSFNTSGEIWAQEIRLKISIGWWCYISNWQNGLRKTCNLQWGDLKM